MSSRPRVSSVEVVAAWAACQRGPRAAAWSRTRRRSWATVSRAARWARVSWTSRTTARATTTAARQVVNVATAPGAVGWVTTGETARETR